MVPPSNGASTEINFKTVTLNTVWRMVQGRAFGVPDAISGNRTSTDYWLPGFRVSEERKPDSSKVIAMHIFRLERFVRKRQP
jgi:hypothetical protein